MRRPVCFDCPHFVATEADAGLCCFELKAGVKVRLILVVNGEEVEWANAKARETVHGYYPRIPPDNPCCHLHPDFLKWKNTPDTLSVEGADDDPFG